MKDSSIICGGFNTHCTYSKSLKPFMLCYAAYFTVIIIQFGTHLFDLIYVATLEVSSLFDLIQNLFGP